jgi:hypothetical protein
MMPIVAGNPGRLCCRVPAVLGMRIVQRQVRRMVGHGNYFRWQVGWHARHAGGSGDRVERKHGHQEPNQKCRERSVHRFAEYSMALFCFEQL